MRPTRILALVIGVFLLIPAVALLTGGGTLAAFYAAERDADGYFETTLEPLQAPGVAVTSGSVAFIVDAGTPERLVDALDGDIRLRVDGSEADDPVFVGIGPREQVDAYLSGKASSMIVGLDEGTPDIHDRQGITNIAAPTEQDFWTAAAVGQGTQELTWPATAGNWSAVVMNGDGSPGVTASVTVGVRSGIVLPVALSLFGIGLVLTAVAVVLIIISATGQRNDPSTAALSAGASTPARAGPDQRPVTLTAALDPALTRWQWLVKWFLAIPHFVALFFLWAAFLVLTVVAGFAILFTGRYPRNIFDFNVGVLRWSWRVSYYAGTGGVGSDRYPPFTLAAQPGDLARLHIDYPQGLSRGLVLVKWWLLAIPHYLIVALLLGSVRWDWGGENTNVDPIGGGGVLGLLVLVAAVILLFTGRYPQALFDLIIGLNRWIYRVIAYAALMTDSYPPFRLDQGGAEPPAEPPPQSPAGQARAVTAHAAEQQPAR